MAAVAVQQIAGSVNPGTSVALAFASNCAAGNTIVATQRLSSLTGTPSASDNNGGTYTQRFKVGAGSAGQNTIWEAANINAGATTVTVSSSSSTRIGGTAREISGLLTTGAFDRSAHATATSTSADSGNTTTLAQAGNMVIGHCGTQSGSTLTVGAGYGNLVTNITGRCGSESKVVNSTAAVNATFGVSVSEAWSCVVAVFKEASSGVTSTFASTLADATMAATTTVANPVTSTLASTLAGCVLAATTTVANPVTSTIATTLADCTMSAASTLTISSTFASTIGNCTMAATTSVANPVTSTFASTLADATMAASTTETISSTFASTLADCTMAANSSVDLGVTSTFAATLAGCPMAATTTVANPVTSTFSATLADCTMAAATTLTIASTFAATLANTTLAATTTVANPVTSTFASTLGGETMAATTTVGSGAITSTFSSTLAGEGMAATTTVANPVTSTFASTLGGVAMAASTSVANPISSTFASVLQGEILSITSLVIGGAQEERATGGWSFEPPIKRRRTDERRSPQRKIDITAAARYSQDIDGAPPSKSGVGLSDESIAEIAGRIGVVAADTARILFRPAVAAEYRERLDRQNMMAIVTILLRYYMEHW